MGKQGPCCHCGVPSTPLWRNGPPDKPVLCNACGSRWRTKGSLTNYTPLHSRAESTNFLNHKASRIKIASGMDKEANFLKRKQPFDNGFNGNSVSNYIDSIWKGIDDDTGNRSSSGSAVSNSENFAQFDTNVNELTGFSQSFANDVDITNPTKKMAQIPRPKASSIATLTKDLCTILHHQQSSGFYGPEEDDLLFDSHKPIFSAETGHGSYLIRDTSSLTRDEDSEASSFFIDNKLYKASETCSYSNLLAIPTSDLRSDRVSNKKRSHHEKSERNQIQLEISESYESQSLLMTRITIHKDVPTNHEEFLGHLTNEDESRQPNSLQSLSGSTDFVDCFSTFSDEGFSTSLSEFKSNGFKKLKSLVLEHSNMTKKCNQETHPSWQGKDKT